MLGSRQVGAEGILSLSDLKAVFESIVATNAWGELESVSGAGSTLDYTHSLRHQLARFVRMFDVRTLFDAPCGDFNWMKEVSFPSHTRYIGADIAESLIAANNRRHAGDWRRFLALDLTRDAFPDADLWFCRDCLFHLPFAMIGCALRNFCASRIEFVMMTNHINITGFHNRDIAAGDFRLLDFHLAPFHLPREVLYRIPDYVHPFPQREMCVWSRAQIGEALDRAGFP